MTGVFKEQRGGQYTWSRASEEDRVGGESKRGHSGLYSAGSWSQ